jgi:hypothetical protein
MQKFILSAALGAASLLGMHGALGAGKAEAGMRADVNAEQRAQGVAHFRDHGPYSFAEAQRLAVRWRRAGKQASVVSGSGGYYVRVFFPN